MFNAVLIWLELELNWAKPDVKVELPEDKFFVPLDKVVIPLFNFVVPCWTDDNAIFKFCIPWDNWFKLLVLFDNFWVPAYKLLAPALIFSPETPNVEKLVFKTCFTCLE